MPSDRFLVTGGLGCLGAWVIKRLTDEGLPAWCYDLGSDPHRLQLIMNDETLASRVTLVEGDIIDVDSLEQVVVANRITHIVHLAALQIPAVRADPILGARINVAGMAAVLEVVRRHSSQVLGLVYASSIAAYGPPALYPPGPLAPDAPLRPDTLYGVFKRANEDMARVYWQDHGVASIGLRPYIVYGPGRDQGLTSTPTKAMLAAAAGRNYTINYRGKYTYQLADDAARAFILSARAGDMTAEVYDLGGSCVELDAIVRAIEAVAPEMAGRIRYDGSTLPFPSEADGARLDAAIGRVGWTRLERGVEQTVAHFRRALAAGRIDLGRATG
jgi:nucleoside-diphosphate-sugar epimerase